MAKEYVSCVLSHIDDMIDKCNNKFSISSDFPFKIKKLDFNDFSINYAKNRLEAETKKREMLICHYENILKQSDKIKRNSNLYLKKREALTKIKKYKTELKTLEEEHPEWMI
jgi:hypothetical protein